MDQPDEPSDDPWQTTHPSETGPVATGDPAQIGRYRVIRLLGEGGFGRVYLAHDDELDRAVAVKIPKSARVRDALDLEAYLKEAKILAKLEHPHIVPVYDAGRTEDGLCFIVSKLVNGSNLREEIREGRPGHLESAELIAAVAEALQHAHTAGLVHRDVKPANILIDEKGRPCLADFGSALRDEDFGREVVVSGTPVYMSPEQVRGEGHRVDGRSDIFSLGVVFYELLTGRRPWKGEDVADVFDQIKNLEARPPRQIDGAIPKELERICIKALAKKASDRYTTARDMAEDLSAFFQTAALSAPPGGVAHSPGSPQSSTQEVTTAPPVTMRSDSDHHAIKIVPKGLRSFDEHDADFFLELLPGPRDRKGLPESIRFWKNQIESTDPDHTFRVGLIYGPSGCGKSSLVKAGLLPMLGEQVLTVHVETTADDTETRLLRELRKSCPELPAGLGLAESLATVRKGRILHAGQKLLVVLDQFEQWLHARRGEHHGELVNALRQCDGAHSQAIVMVRDDFWMAATRLMSELEVELIQGHNTAAVDLFDPRHARDVLTRFGIAYGTLPEHRRAMTKEQRAFLDQAIAELARDGQVVPLRLTLFAEMVKGKQWTPATLRAVGGMEGVGVTFLEETFVSPHANPRHRLRRAAATDVLKALLPESGTDIKGRMRSDQELQEAAGSVSQPRKFAEVLHILDNELRLITPTDPQGASGDRLPTAGTGRYFQLTHDYLVPSLREWLTRKQKETRRGRAALKLEERASLWNARTESRHLPSTGEWAGILLLTRKRDWTEAQQRMMKRAGRVHGLRALGLTAVAAVLLAAGVTVRDRVVTANRATAAHGLVQQLLKADTAQVPENIRALANYRRWADPELKKAAQESPADSRARLHASLALLPGDASQAEYLHTRLLAASPAELPVIWGILREHDRDVEPRLWTLLDDSAADPDKRFRGACALASVDSARIDEKWSNVAPFVADQFLAAALRNPSEYAVLIETLRPLRRWLVPTLSLTFRDQAKSESERSLATNILADYTADDPGRLADVLMFADAKPFSTLFPVAQKKAGEVLPVFQAEIEKSTRSVTTIVPDGPPPTASVRHRLAVSEEVKDGLAARQARAAIALARLGKAESVWPLLRHSADPRLRSFIVNWLSPLGADPHAIAAELDRLDSHATGKTSVGRGAPDPAPPTTAGLPSDSMDDILFHPETSTRRALILALGTYGTNGFSPGEREQLLGKLLELYENDPDSGIHGAAEWTLRKWGQLAKIADANARLAKQKDRAGRRWFVNSHGQTFVKIEGPTEFHMGSPRSERDRIADNETRHRRVIPRSFAIAAKEVTFEQYQLFALESPDHQRSISRYSPDRTGPMNGTSWFDAAAYCNWLSRKEGLEECYEPNSRKKYAQGMTIRADALHRSGYRLPTESEWEYSCRAGADTSRYFGSSVDLLPAYAWYQKSSDDRLWPGGSLFPNDLGLFDMLGNVHEWCQDSPLAYRPDHSGIQIDDINNIDSVSGLRLLRGGSFTYRPSHVRSAIRDGYGPANRNRDNGFRLARTYQ